MRRVRYSVAMSLDGYIAGPKGEYDWIVMDPDIDFGALFKEMQAHAVEIAIIPVLLGTRVPMRPSPAKLEKLRLTKHPVYEKTATALLNYVETYPVGPCYRSS